MGGGRRAARSRRSEVAGGKGPCAVRSRSSKEHRIPPQPPPPPRCHAGSLQQCRQRQWKWEGAAEGAAEERRFGMSADIPLTQPSVFTGH